LVPLIGRFIKEILEHGIFLGQVTFERYFKGRRENSGRGFKRGRLRKGFGTLPIWGLGRSILFSPRADVNLGRYFQGFEL